MEAFLSLSVSHTVTQSLNLILNDLLDDIANTVSFFVPTPQNALVGWHDGNAHLIWQVVNWVHFGINRQHGQAKRHHFELLHRKAPLIQAAAGTKTKGHLKESNSINKMSGRKLKPDMRDSTNLNDLIRLAWIDNGKVEMSVRIENYKREHKYLCFLFWRLSTFNKNFERVTFPYQQQRLR